MASDVIVCRCEEVTRTEIEAAIEEGAATVDGIKRRTRACMGLCQGRTCRRLVAQILAEKMGKRVGEVDFGHLRPPTRPVKIGMLVSSQPDSSASDGAAMGRGSR